jgi:hypothetical protein
MNIATIIVNQCDGCCSVMVLQSDTDQELFETSWYDGWQVQFCPACKVKPEHVAEMHADEAKTPEIAAALAAEANRMELLNAN